MSDYNAAIFSSRGMSEERLNGSVYRYWCAHSLAQVMQRYLEGPIDFLDAGGREGSILGLLKSLQLTGTYTCLDLDPKVEPDHHDGFDIQTVQCSFEDFRPIEQYDAVLFENSLECVGDYRQLAWLPDALKPRGMVFVTLVTHSARSLYPGFYRSGGCHYLDRDELDAAFSAIGLQIVECIALVGLTGRIAQYVFQLKLKKLINIVRSRVLRGGAAGHQQHDPMRYINRYINAVTARIDLWLFPYWPVGHCVVLQRAR